MPFINAKGIYKDLDDEVITLAQLKALIPDPITEQGQIIRLTDGRVFYYHPTSVLAADDIFVVAPKDGQGRYLISPGFTQNIPLPFDFNKADAAVMATIPTNCVLRIPRCYWEVTTGFTGGSSSAIGLSSSQSPHNTKGDLHGGASGDVAATLVAGAAIEGTVGADIAAGVILIGGATIRFDRIVSAFTAGVGVAHVIGEVLANPGV